MPKKKALTKRIREVVTSPYRAFKALCFWIGFVVMVSTLGVSAYGFYLYSSLPTSEELQFHRVQKRAKSWVATKLKESKRKVRWSSIDNVSRDYLYSIVISEDARFFEHDGINYDSIAYSIAENIKRKRYALGGSTITQQVVKNLYLSKEKSLIRKIKEAVISKKLENRLSKNEILEIYLNIIEVGPDLYGSAWAASHYFRKTPAEINAAEGGFIALMLPSPRRNHYTLFENENFTPNKKKKYKRIMRDMLHSEYISMKQYLQYLNYDFYYTKRPVNVPTVNRS